MKISISIAVAAVLLISGCGNKDGAPKSAPAAVKAEGTTQSPVPPSPPPPLPPPNVSKDAEVQSPTPGQANDHSNPSFKGGGAPDKNK